MSIAVFTQTAVLFAIIVLGYVAGKTKVMSLEGNKSLSTMVNSIANPCSVLYAALCSQRSFTNLQILQLLGIAIGMFVFLILAAQLVPKMLGVKKEESGQYKYMMIFSNISYMGIPVISAVLGESATISAAIFIMVFYCFLYTYGIFLLRDKKETFKLGALINPTLIASLTGIVCYFFNVRASGILANLLQSVRNITTPCAMLIVGATLSTLPLKAVFSNWRLYIVSLLKLLILPGAVYLCLRPYLGDNIVFKALIVMMSMPIAANFTTLCAQYDRDQQLSASAIFITTALSLVTIPLIAGLLTS